MHEDGLGNGSPLPPGERVDDARYMNICMSNVNWSSVRRTAILALAICAVAGCERSANDGGAPPAANSPSESKAEQPAPTQEPPAPALPGSVAPLPEYGPDQWLFVEAAAKDAPGGWATGSFNKERNKLIIDTHDVTAFAIEIEKIAINWDRVVILSIDGVNTELRKRNVARLHFVRDKQGAWQITEP